MHICGASLLLTVPASRRRTVPGVFVSSLPRPFDLRVLMRRGVCLAALFFPYILLRMFLSHVPGTPFLSSFQSSTLEKSGLMRRAENPFAFISGLPRVLSINFLQVAGWHSIFRSDRLCVYVCVRVSKCMSLFVDVCLCLCLC